MSKSGDDFMAYLVARGAYLRQTVDIKNSENDFLIENGILKKYVGPGGDVVIPEGVTEIGPGAFEPSRFEDYESLHSITFPQGLKIIGRRAFASCIALKEVTLPESVCEIGMAALRGHMTTKRVEIFSSALQLPEKKLAIFEYPPAEMDKLFLFAPNLPFDIWKKHGLATAAAKTFLSEYARYTNVPVAEEYITYIASQRRTLLPGILNSDNVDILKMLVIAGKITKKNYTENYLEPAINCNAKQCIAYLKETFRDISPSGDSEKAKSSNAKTEWNGVNFSLDGRKMLRYAGNAEGTIYHVPEGTVEICSEAFYMPLLHGILLPESVKKIQDMAFIAKGGQPLFVKLPDGLARLPDGAFSGGFFDEDDGLPDSTKYYYIATKNVNFLGKLSTSTYSKGNRCPVYIGGPLDDVPVKIKASAVRGFLYVTEHGLADLSQWKKSYVEHIAKNEETYLKQAQKDHFLARWMMEEQVLSRKGTNQLLSKINREKHPDMIAALLNYQNYLPRSKETDPLSEHSPDIKRRVVHEERRNQLVDKKGIEGVTFVATGELRNFGFIDEYTGAHDLSDLKAFIETRGGFLRSAISSKTDYLICNDLSSKTTKAQKAKEMGTPIISEEEFLKMAEKQAD